MEALDVFRRFALSVDIINDSDKNQINSILQNICLNILGADFFEVQKKASPDRLGRYNHLNTLWSNVQGTTTTIKDNGEYKGQTSYAFAENRKLWINREDGGILRDGSDCIDSWSKSEHLPKYWKYKYARSEYRTSVILPLEFDGIYAPIGILNMEFEKHYSFSEKNEKIFENLAKSIAIIAHSYQVRSYQAVNTTSALQELTRLSNRQLNILDKPRVFVAFPMKCDQDVMDLIREIAREFEATYEFIFWDEINQSGSIDEHLIKAVTTSKFGIAYFSEIAENGRFRDNPNVVFEAGMFHAMTSKEFFKEPVKWIPIREKNSGPTPFDFAHQRTIGIERDKETEKIRDAEEFKEKLRAMLKLF